jgi:hypothetical protein
MKEKALVNALIVVSVSLVSVLRLVGDLIPPHLVRNMCFEIEEALKNVNSEYTKTIREDIAKIKELIREEQ